MPKLKPKKAPGGHVNPQPFEPKQTPQPKKDPNQAQAQAQAQKGPWGPCEPPTL